MESLLITVICVLVALVSVTIWWWRSAIGKAQVRERDLLMSLAQAQTQAALGDEARKSLVAAQHERTEATNRSVAAESKAAVAVAETDALRVGREDLTRQLNEERQRFIDQSAFLQRAESARSGGEAALEALRGSLRDDQTRLHAVEQELTTVRADRDRAVSTISKLSEQVAHLELEQSAARRAVDAKDAAQLAQSAAETAKASAEMDARGVRDQVADLIIRLAAAESELVKRDFERATMAQRYSESEAARGAAQAAHDAANNSIADQKLRLAEASEQMERLRGDLTEAQTAIQRLRGELSQSDAVAAERQQAQEQAREMLSTQLRALTQQLYEEQGKAMLGEGRLQLEQTLAPFRERIQELQTRIDQVHAVDIKDRAQLQSDLESMLVAQTQLSAEAHQLGRALRADSKAQGTWGELTLQRLLESSQLERGLTYELQVQVRSDEGTIGRPDAVIFLPDQKALAIDAKVSLTSFIKATNATTDEERATYLQEHLQSVRNHMHALAMRDYPEAIKESLKGHVLDLTLIFMPSEASFSAAVIQDSELWAEALRQRIIIVSPTTLLATLRVVAQIWRVEKQNRNASAIAKEAGGIVEKLRGALEDFDAVEKAMQVAVEAFGRARGKLVSGKGNMIRRAEKLIRLGAPAKDETKARIAAEGDDEEDDISEPPAHVLFTPT